MKYRNKTFFISHIVSLLFIFQSHTIFGQTSTVVDWSTIKSACTGAVNATMNPAGTVNISLSSGSFTNFGPQSPNLTTCNTRYYSPKYITSGTTSWNLTGLGMGVDWANLSSTATIDITFNTYVCTPITFSINDINASWNGSNYDWLDLVTVNSWDWNQSTQLSTAIAVNTTYFTINYASCGCQANMTSSTAKVAANSIKGASIGCNSSDGNPGCGGSTNIAFTLNSPTGMIKRFTIVYGNATSATDGSGTYTAKANPDAQDIVISNITAYAPSLSVAGICPAGTLKATETAFPTSPTYAWTADAAVFGAGPSTTTNTAANTSSTVSYVTPSTSNVFTVTATSASGCAVTTTTTIANDFCILLSAEVTSFTGKCIGSKKIFNWQTISEVDNAHFTLEKSKDGETFETIEKIKGNGNSTRQLNYNYSYEEENASYKYYRLSQTDFNGKTKILKLTYLNCVDAVGNLRLSPNPANSEIKLEFEASKESVFTVNITDFIGRVLKSIQYVATEGFNQSLVNIQDLPSGSYQVSINSNTGSRPQILKFIKTIGD